MLKRITRFGAAIIAAFALSLPAAASTFSIDYSDLWGGGQPNPTESGWGLNLVQQGDVIFATWFVFAQNGAPTWFSATLNPSGGSTTWSGSVVFVPTGPFYGGPWTSNPPGNVVGSATITFSNANAGTLNWSANGVNVSKQISRFSLRAANLNGRYLGGMVSTCSNGQQILIFDTLRVTQNNTAVNMSVDFFNSAGTASNCQFNGTLNTMGRTGSISGNYTCSGGANNSGSFSVTNLESSINGFNGTFTGSDQFCTGGMTGRFGGVKDVIN